MFEPEVIIIVQIQQCTVHVKQDSAHLMPPDHEVRRFLRKRCINRHGSRYRLQLHPRRIGFRLGVGKRRAEPACPRYPLVRRDDRDALEVVRVRSGELDVLPGDIYGETRHVG